MGRLWHIGRKPIVIAHRGGGNEEAENSLTAFANMAAKGFRYIETDSHATQDGVVILFHDPTLDRTTNGSGSISDHTADQIAAVRDASGNSPVRLRDALEQFPSVVFNIDAKSVQVVAHLARTIEDAGATARVSLSSFSEKRLKVLRRLLPGVRSSIGTSGIATLVFASILPAALGATVARAVPGADQGVEAVQVPIADHGIRVVTPRFVRLCHKLGYAVHVWTINDQTTMHRLLAMGVDGLVTDEPSLAQRVIDKYWAARAHFA
ncbi:MAG: glycerophosphodiester phosphodiesterase [Actinomycetaceae bacterium]|nr:glycerophosphodiester phosphodiesterase [Arcanobacterium sp.]MDD7504992.1 glycerophosphodiester phosphodiesterase [Actinomycetaceae bacterium]MDY6143351.1 glycerophosphodiester phosphodiesterase [Arcanobacterium sp.]